jgi:hypothetical protein
MVTMTLMSQAYGFQGWMQFWGGMLSYFAIFNDFGFSPSDLMGVANKSLIAPNSGDVYNPTHVTLGNTVA